ncbi:hypothetical protein PCC8801_0635 [Rippkaea orientalis PCC 8801]|uniref:Uncharacterized protein n=1 Tax=Rippkaea orientalis (strain PCC 8801 / RF-1) TaxID=41431 RepID=B7JXG6_RIPO1|nr:hypothetical protein PCC8801_0635 [Rippkaea orientalis PCC 8801]
MLSHQLLDWLTVFGYIAFTTFIIWRIFMTKQS